MTAKDCFCCSQDEFYKKHKREIALLQASGGLQDIIVDVLGLLLKTTSGSQHLVIMTEHHPKRNCAIPTKKAISTHRVTIYLDDWILLYGILGYIMTDKGPQFVFKLSATLYLFLGAEKLTITSYHLPPNALVERFNGTLAGRMHHYVSQHQKAWDI